MPEASIKRIGKYEIQSELGRGGFGRVYRAYDPTVGRLVAIKILTAEGNKDLLTRFKNEAAAAGNLRHKNIITIYDFGDYNGLPYLVMEFLEGEDLQQIIFQKKPLTLLQKVSIMLQVADGLHCAHRNGVVHRDVKPGNIRLLPDGTIKLMDFGIARLVGDTAATRLTRQGHVIGTLLYMAPEQVMGADVDFLCDIFAYGVTYYEFLTGKHPFQAPDPRAVFYKITAEDPEPITSFVPECPEALEHIIRRALHKDRELRYQSLRDVVFDTEPILMELKQEHAAQLLIGANGLYVEHRLEEAQTVLTEILDLDPTNRQARQLRETIQTQLLQKLLQPRIQALLQKGEEALLSRKFTEAVENFEMALRLDRANADVQAKLADVRTKLEQSKRSARLLAEARSEFARQELDNAYRKLSELLQADPEHSEARQFFEAVRKEVERREKQKRLEEALSRAEELMYAKAFEDALGALDGLPPDQRSHVEVQQLASRIAAAKREHEVQQRLAAELVRARELMASQQFAEAVDRLESMAAEFPADEQIAALLTDAHERLGAKLKAEALARVTRDAEAFAEKREFGRALELIGQALVAYPDESALLALRERAGAAQAAWMREQAVQCALKQAEELRLNARFAEAVAALDACEQREDARLEDMRRRIAADWERFRRDEAIHAALKEARRLIESDDPESAVRLLDAAAEEHRAHSELAGALSQAHECLRGKLCRDAESLVARHDFDGALEMLARGLDAYPGDPAISSLRSRIHEISEAIAEAHWLVQSDDAEGAVRVLRAAAARYQAERELAGPLSDAHAALRAKLCREAQSRAAHQDFGGALEILGRALESYPGEPAITALRDRLQGISDAISEASRLGRSGDPEGAVRVLQSAVVQHRAKRELAEALARAHEALRAKLCQDIEARVEQRDFDGALEIVARGLEAYPGEASIAALRDRIQGIKQASAEAERLIQSDDPERAIGVLKEAATQHRAEREVAEPLSRAHEALRTKLCREAQSHAAQGDFDDALQIVARGLEAYPGEAAIAALRDRIQGIKQAIGEAERLVQSDDPERAIGLLKAAVAQHEAGRELTDALARAHEALRTKLCREAQARAAQGDFDHALQIVARGLEAYPGEASIAALRDRIQGIKQASAEAERLVQSDDPERAIGVLKAAVAQHEAGRELAGALSRAHQALRTKLCREAQTRAAQGDFDDALQILARGLEAYPGDAAITALRDRIRGIKEASGEAERLIQSNDPERAINILSSAATQHHAERELKERLSRAHEALRTKLCRDAQTRAAQGDFDDALQILARGVEAYPGEASIAALRDRIQGIKEASAEAERLVQSDDPERAIGVLKAAVAQHDAQRELADALARAHEALRTKLCREGQARAAEGDFDDALQILARALEAYPGEASIAALRDRIQGIKQAIGEADRLVQSDDPERAIGVLTQAATQHGAGRELAGALSRAHEALRTKLCREARSRGARGDFDAALQILARGLEAYPGDAAITALRDRIRAIRQAISEADRSLQSDDPERAINILSSAATQHHAERELTGALAHAHEAMRAKLSREAQSQAAQGDFDAALQILAQGLEAYPGEPSITAIRGRIQAIKQAIEAAHRFLQSDEPESAVRVLKAAATQHQAERELAQPLAQAQEALRARQRAAAIDSICRAAMACIARDDFPGALRLIEEASTSYPGEARIAEVRDTVRAAKAAREREQGIARILAESRRFIESGDPASAVRALETALAAYAGETLIAEELVKAREALLSKEKAEAIGDLCRETQLYIDLKEFDRAEELVENALEAYSGDLHLTQLQQTILTERNAWEEHNRQESIHRALAEAEELLAAHDEQRAVEILEKAAGEWPGEIPIIEMLSKARTALRETQRVRAVEEVCRETQLHIQAKEYDTAEQIVDKGLRTYGDDYRLTALRETLLATKAHELVQQEDNGARLAVAMPQVAEPPVSPPRPPARPEPVEALQPPKPVRRRPWKVAAAIAAAVIAAAAAFVLYERASSPQPGLAELEIDTTPRGATVRVNGKECTTPGCRVQLPPGRYEIQARLQGYDTGRRSFTIEKSGTPAPVHLTLAPLPARILISTNFEEGSVALNGKEVGRLERGELRLDRLDPGTHSLSVSAKESTVTANLETPLAERPRVSGPLQTRDAEAVFVASLGTNAVVTCGDCAGSVEIDASTRGTLSDGRLNISNLAPGTHEMTLAVHGVRRRIVFQSGDVPAIYAVLTSARDAGMLVVDTGSVDGVAVVIDGKPSGRTAAGQLRLPLEARPHVIRVEKSGYRSEPREIRTVIARGEQASARFRLEPQPAAMAISGFPPQTEIRVDGVAIGTVKADGTGSFEVPPGQHNVEFVKPGYLPASISLAFSPGTPVSVDRALVQMKPEPPKAVAKAELPPPLDPAVVERQAWERIRNGRSRPEIESYLQRSPQGRYAEEARTTLEQIDWEQLNKQDSKSLRQFLSVHSNGAHAAAAKAQLAQLEADAKKQELEVKRQELEAKKQEEMRRMAAERESIRGVLKSYSDAYRNKDLARVRALWPRAPSPVLQSIRQTFKDFREVVFDLTIAGEPVVEGDKATVRCERFVRQIDQTGSHENRGDAVVTLVKTNGNWVIDSIR